MPRPHTPLDDADEDPTGASPERADLRNGVQSLEIGVRVLRAIGDGGRAMMLKDIAAQAGLSAPKVHRYLVSLVRSGLVEQDPATSRYDLGPLALTLGLAAVDRIDRIKLGLQACADLRDQINHTTALAVWSENGPVIIRSMRPYRPITVNVVTGSALHVLTSASGRAFAAWLSPAQTAALIGRERATLPLPAALQTDAGVQDMLAQVRTQGVAVVHDYHLVPGVSAAGAPVFSHSGEVKLTLLVIGVKGMIDLGPDGPVVQALAQAAQALSRRLGWSGVSAQPV